MEVKILKPTDADYPTVAMSLIPYKEKYDLFNIGGLTVVLLMQVFDALASIKPDIVVRNGIECCPTCGKPIKDVYVQSDYEAQLKAEKNALLDKLMRKMKERDEDNGGEPLNAIDQGYHLAFEHLCEEINELKENEDGDK